MTARAQTGEATRPLLDDIPAWQEHLARVADARRRHALVVEQAIEEGRRHREAVEAHKAAIQKAYHDGTPIPTDTPQESVSLQHAVDAANAEQAALAEDGHRLLADLAPDVEALARERWTTVAEEVRDAVEVLERAASQTTSDLSDVARARGALDSRDGGHRARNTRQRVTVAGLVALLERGEDPYRLLGPQQVLGLTRIVRDDSGEEHTVHLQR